MNVKLSAIALALIATSASAFAVDTTGISRAQVRAEVEQAYARGELNRQSEFVEHVSNNRATSGSPSRAEVRAELDRAYAQGRSTTQSSEFVEHTAIAGGKTRAEVRAEVEQAYAQGQIGNQEEFVEHTRVATGKSRDEVRAETLRAANATNASGS